MQTIKANHSGEISNLGVDTGQMGIFDAVRYPKTEEEVGDYDSAESFYGSICRLTGSEDGIDDKRLDINDMGCVSPTAFGDGTYPGYIVTRNGECVAAAVDFNPPDDEEEEKDSADSCDE